MASHANDCYVEAATPTILKPTHKRSDVTNDSSQASIAVAIPQSNEFNHAYVPPDAGADTCGKKFGCWLGRAGILVLFHLLNAVLGIMAFCVVVTAFPLSIGLIPLCCIGVLIFQVLTFLVECFARVDIAVTNMLIPDHEPKLELHSRVMSGLTNESRNTIWSRLVFVSPWNLLAMLYFATVKFAIGILSLCSICLAIGPIFANTGMWDDQQMYSVTYNDHPALYVLLIVLSILVGIALIPIVAWGSRKCTECVCGRRLSPASHAPIDITHVVTAEPVNAAPLTPPIQSPAKYDHCKV